MKLNEKLYNLRKENKLSLTKVSAYLEVSTKEIKLWESGEEVPSYRNLWYLAKLYNADFEDLVDKEYRKNILKKANKINKKDIIIRIIVCLTILLLLIIFGYLVNFVVKSINPLMKFIVGSTIEQIFGTIFLIILIAFLIIVFIYFIYKILLYIIMEYKDKK